MPRERVTHPIIMGVVGDSATGKTTLCDGIAEILGRDQVTVICSDDYHRYSRAERAELGISAIDPRGNYIDILEQHLQALRQGKPVLKPVYNHNGGTLERPEYVEPRPYIIMEGLLGYSTRAMRDCYDVKIYLEPEDDLRVQWKMQRDVAKRGYTPEQVQAALDRRRQDSAHFIHPQRVFTDVAVSFYRTKGTTAGDEHLNVRHILRPTLPHPDLSPLLDGAANSGLYLELMRDSDGKPVDVLEIAGNISDNRAERLEDLLWTLIPEASHLQDNVGSFINRDNRKVKSHTLALTQLLLSYYMVKAALGVHTV
jgi:phosphoribulokinase